MGAVVGFNYSTWVALFPVFSYVSSAQAQMYFNLATQYHRNDGIGPVQDTTTQSNLLNLLTAHIAQLLNPPNSDGTGGGNPTGLVGRINTASEGSVSVGTENNYPPGTVQWFQQTQYGAMYWAASMPFRTMQYVPGKVRQFDRWIYPI